MFDANRVFLNAMHYTFVPTLVQLAGVPLHFFWAYYFVRLKGYGIVGVCWAHNLTYLTLLVLITLYTARIREIAAAWFLPTRASFDDISEYLWLGIPGSLMMVIGWLGTDIIPVWAGLIGIRE